MQLFLLLRLDVVYLHLEINNIILYLRIWNFICNNISMNGMTDFHSVVKYKY